MRVKLSLAPRESNLSDKLWLTLRIEFPEGVSVGKPSLDAVLDEFAIRDVDQALPRWENGRRVLQQVYVLEPTHLGKRTLGPLRIAFRDSRRHDDRDQFIETKPLEFEIGTDVDTNRLSLAELRPLVSGVESARKRESAAGWLWGGMAIAMGVAVLYWRRRVAAGRATDAVPTPQELAQHELSDIFREDLAEQDIDLFYVELTGVIRRYLERVLQVCVQEHTTEELLQLVAARGMLAPEQLHRLRIFFESADRVKFAAYRPSFEEIEESMKWARRFVGFDDAEVAA